MREITAFLNRLRGFAADPRSNGPELLVSIGLLLVIAGLLVVFFLWIRFKLVQRKYKALRRAKAAAQEEKRSLEDLDASADLSEPGFHDDESIIEASSAGHLDPVSGADTSTSDTMDPAAIAGTSGLGIWRRRWRPWWLWIFVPLIIIIVLALALTIPRYTMGKVSYCDTCHAMQNSVQSWRTSNHSKVACQNCHEPPGISGIITSQVQGWSNISLSSLYWRRHRPITLKTPVSPGCLSCHEQIGKKIILYNDTIKISHKEFMFSIACESCHPNAGHSGKRIKGRMMDRCVECHKENGASVACFICHEAEPTWTAQRLQNYVKAASSYGSCLKCHPTEMRCTQCHAKPKREADD